MKLISTRLAVGFFALFLCVAAGSRSAPIGHAVPHRSPIDVAVLPDGCRVLTANYRADSVSFVDISKGVILAKVLAGTSRPAWPVRDGKRAAVSNSWSGTVSLFDIADSTLRSIGTVTVGDQPRSLVFAANGESFFVGWSGGGASVAGCLEDEDSAAPLGCAGELRRLVLYDGELPGGSQRPVLPGSMLECADRRLGVGAAPSLMRSICTA